MVTVTLTTDPIDHDQIEIGSLNHIAPFTNTTLVFHENNWLITQTIEITAINDDIQEITPKTVTLMHTSVSTNPDYNSIAIDDVVVQVVDEDVSNLLVSPLTLNISEDGMTANYDVVLNSEPTAPVTITISHDPLQTNLALTGVSTLALTNTLVFTSGNWHIAQTIIVTAVNDSWDETETHTSTIEHVITSDDPRYAALNQTVLVLIADNDTVGLIVSVTDIGLAEDGSITSTYQVYLASEPYNDVSVTIADMQSQVSYDQLTLSADTLYFTNLTWNIPQTVVVMAIDDTIDETSAQNSTILHHVTESDDQSYNESSNLGLTDINVLIIDNDEHGINIEPTDLVLSEDGITDTYQIVLTSEPYEVVNIIVSEGSGQVDLSNSNLNFTPSNWHVPQIIAVTARDDSAAEEDFHNAVITHTVNSDDPNYDIGYNSIFAQDVTAVIEDNDNFAVTVSKDLVDVTEDGITATYQIYLNSEPTGPVIITSTFDNMQVSISPMALTFLKSEWDIPRTIQVTAVNDDIDESEQHQTLVRHTAGSADPSYNDIFISPIYVDIADNDTVGIYVDETLLNVSENGITDSYTIVLNSEPTALVEIDMAIESPNLSASISPNQLTFNADTWDTPQTIVVSAIDDLIDETMPHTYTIAHTVISNDPKYDDFDISDVTISIEDNDTTDVTISRQFIHISESCIEDESVNTKSVNTRSVNACFDMYTIVLNSEPTSTVIITMTHDSEIIMSDTELAFTADNWDMPQPITVTAINDNWDETTPHTSTIAHFIQSDDPLYSKQILMNVYAVITDDDIVGVTISPTLFMLNEGDTDTYQISLDSEPTDVVTITVKANIDDSGGSMLALTSTMLVFSPTTWTEPQTVTLTVIDDNFDEPDTYQNIISHTITSNDLMYDMLTLSEVTITITDDDTYGVTISPTLFMLNEGDTDTYQINLNSEPTDVVTITLDLALSTTPPIQRGGAGGGVDLALTSTMLVFSPTTWTEPQTVTLTVIDDNFDEPDVYYNTITHAITSTDVMYGMLILPDVTIAITDDDTLGVTITPTQLTMLEGESGSYQISLNSRPTATVTIDMTPLSLLKGRGKGWGQISISHASIIFEPDSWTEIQTIQVTAIDDDIDEADTHASIIAHTSTSDDPQYNTSAQMQVTVIISDDDTANIVVSPTMLDIAEGEHGQTYSIVLESEPITTVAISINPDEQLNTIIAPADIGTGVGTINFNTVEFDKNNWHIPKYITVTAIDDPYVEELHTGVITQVVGSNDPNYNAFTMSNITATIIDNDSGELLIEPLSMFISEDGITDTYTMKLGSEPSASVFVTIKTTDEQLTVSPSSVRFDVTNWMIPHAVIVTANDDDQIEDELHMAVITNSVGSPDQLYDGIVVTMTAVITDNDELPQEIDLFVSKTVNKSMIELGQEIIYTIVVSNPSLSMATGVVLTDVLPNMANLGTINLPSPINIEMGSAILTQGTCNHNNDTGASKLTLTKVLCNLGTINPQSAVTISLHVTPTVDGGSGSLNISNDAVIRLQHVYSYRA
ncbi:MAG: hypothetical protein B6242_15145 [Anaerolineaceae bacterium 4572_78]|nr:MAG: hypothetical protein B6242_15145 [Anaerolineaceae bacterium 4572_78]